MRWSQVAAVGFNVAALATAALLVTFTDLAFRWSTTLDADPQVVTRANLTIFVTAISVVGLIMLVVAGAATPPIWLLAAALTAPFLLATWLGGKAFNIMSEIAVRRVALGMVLAMGAIGLIF